MRIERMCVARQVGRRLVGVLAERYRAGRHILLDVQVSQRRNYSVQLGPIANPRSKGSDRVHLYQALGKARAHDHRPARMRTYTYGSSNE